MFIQFCRRCMRTSTRALAPTTAAIRRPLINAPIQAGTTTNICPCPPFPSTFPIHSNMESFPLFFSMHVFVFLVHDNVCKGLFLQYLSKNICGDNCCRYIYFLRKLWQRYMWQVYIFIVAEKQVAKRLKSQMKENAFHIQIWIWKNQIGLRLVLQTTSNIFFLLC